MNPRIIIALALALTCNLSFSATLDGCVVRVADGDTVTVELDNGKRERIRFEGIDAPESTQSYGRKSRENLIDLLKTYGSCVTVEYERRDNYGRIVGKVISGGVDLNLEQVKSGSAWVYRNYLKNLSPADKARYIAAEVSARNRDAGLWIEPNPTAPWIYRRSKR
ncbi:thermonuclease family protein [Turicimonas muris]|uniref:thermonuclease family protein n=1 Tax=Turicimonas muris TaxID=1796652 RepID=UPI0024941B4A|nr:thermonuclease family protein [Turicimonas muris]